MASVYDVYIYSLFARPVLRFMRACFWLSCGIRLEGGSGGAVLPVFVFRSGFVGKGASFGYSHWLHRTRWLLGRLIALTWEDSARLSNHGNQPCRPAPLNPKMGLRASCSRGVLSSCPLALSPSGWEFSSCGLRLHTAQCAGGAIASVQCSDVFCPIPLRWRDVRR